MTNKASLRGQEETTREGRIEELTLEIAQLDAQAAKARTVLAELQREVVTAERRLANSHASDLLAANEQLVLAAMRAQSDAETVARALNDATRAAERDALTELPNRVLLFDRFAQAIATARRRRARLGLLFLDLDDFKQINDTLGHAAGDEVLKIAARRLKESVRDADTVSRYGGDEFVILLTDVSQPSDALRIAGKLIEALGAPSPIRDHVLRVTASVGISIYPDNADDMHTLIDCADAAMYYAKKHGLRTLISAGSAPIDTASSGTG